MLTDFSSSHGYAELSVPEINRAAFRFIDHLSILCQLMSSLFDWLPMTLPVSPWNTPANVQQTKDPHVIDMRYKTLRISHPEKHLHYINGIEVWHFNFLKTPVSNKKHKKKNKNLKEQNNTKSPTHPLLSQMGWCSYHRRNRIVHKRLEIPISPCFI